MELMEKLEKRPWPLKIIDGFGTIAAILGIIAAILDLAGLLDNIKFTSDRILPVILLLVGTVILSLVFERKYQFSRLGRKLDMALDSFAQGAFYLKNEDLVNGVLSDQVTNSGDFIYSIGAKSSIPQYLSTIQKKAKNREIEYKRILSGSHITHDLHLHLSPLLKKKENVKIAWTKSEKYGTWTVTNKKVVYVFPSPTPKYSGMIFDNELQASRQVANFFEILNSCTDVVSERGLTVLCEICSPQETCKNIDEIQKVLNEEILISNTSH